MERTSLLNKSSYFLSSALFHFFIFIPLCFYLYTCAPTIGLGDTGLLVDGIKHFKINTHVNNHNITVILGWLFQFLPIDNIAYKANLVSVIVGSTTIALFYLLIYKIFRSRLTAILSASFLMVSNSMWWHSTLSEVYAVNALFMVIALYLLYAMQNDYKDKYLYGLFFIAGLSIFNHVLMGALAVGAAVALFYRMIENKKECVKIFLFCSLFFLLGFMPYLLTFIKDIKILGFWGALEWASGGDFKGIMFKGTLSYALYDYAYLIFKQFPSAFLLLIPTGFYFLVKTWKVSKAFLALMIIFVMISWFFMFYQTWDKFAFLLPAFVILVFFGTYGLHFVLDFLRKKKNIFLNAVVAVILIVSLWFPSYLYAHLAKWGSNPGSMWFEKYNNTHSHNTHKTSEYIANPNKRNYYDVEEFADLIFEKIPHGAILFDDDSRTFYPLAWYYQKYYQKRPDLRIEMVNSWGFDNWGAGESGFVKALRKAYEGDEDFFLVSLGHPFNTFLNNVKEKGRYKFKKFALNDSRWIYKLITAKEAGVLADHTHNMWDEIGLGSPFTLDLKKSHILYAREGKVIEQAMNPYGEWWVSDDQIFFGTQNIGGEIGFLFRFPQFFEADVEIKFTMAEDFGIVEIYLNNKVISDPIDLYSPNVYFQKITLKNIEMNKGNNILVFKVVGKNYKSKAFNVGVDNLLITPKTEEAEKES